MPLFLKVDITLLAASTAVSAALLLVALGTGLARDINRWFALFSATVLTWTVAMLLLRVALWYGSGSPARLAEVAVLAYAFMGPFLLLFTARYAGMERHWADALGIAALGIVGVLGFPVFSHVLFTDPRLLANGTLVLTVSPGGIAAAAVPLACMALSLGLFWIRRRTIREPFLALGSFALFAGAVAGGIVQVPFPVSSFTTLAAVAIFGTGIVRRQIFNPLREITDALEQRADRLELIARVGRSATALLDLDELLSQAVRLIRDTFGYFSAAVMLIEDDELVLRATTLESLASGEGRRLRVGRDGITGWVAARGEPSLVPDVRRDPRYLSFTGDAKTRSELAVPIRLAGRVIGVLDVQSARVNAFDELDLFTLQTVADQLAVAIGNSRLYRSARQRAERLAAVNRVSAAVGAVLDLDALLETVRREVSEVFQADAFFVALYDARADELDFRIQVDEGVIEPPSREKVGAGFTSRVIREKRPLLIHDVAAELAGLPEPLLYGSFKMPRSWIGAPMVVGEELVGVISVQSYGERSYGEEDSQLLVTIADQAAVAIENARLYEGAREELAERRRTERVLRESEQQFRSLAEQSPNMIFIYGSRRFLYANPECEMVMGWPREETCSPSFSWRRTIAPEYRTAVMELYREQINGRTTGPLEVALVARDGRRYECILTTSLVQYGGLRAVLGIVTDITRRKRTERFFQTLNVASLAMQQSLSPDEIFPIMLNALAGLGIAGAVFLTDGSADRLAPAHLAPAGGAALGAAAGAPRLSVAEMPVLVRVMRDAETIFAVLSGSELAAWQSALAASSPPGAGLPRAGPRVVFAPLHVGGEVFGILAVEPGDLAEDEAPQTVTAFALTAAAAWRKTALVHDLEESLAELRRTQEQLVHAQKMEAIGRLAGGIAHDFNNLLTVISGYADLLADSLGTDSGALADLGEIRGAIKRAAALTGRLLAFSRKQVLRPQVFDLNEVVAASEKLLRPLIGEDIELVVALTPSPGSVRADPNQIEQVIINLAVNARDAMPGGGRLRLETAAVELADDDPAVAADLAPGSWVVLSVSDSGHGMNDEVKRHLFEPFFTTKENGKGTGLGLSTVYGIVSQTRGAVRVASAPGEGTAFTIYLPRVSGSAVLAGTDSAAPRRRAGAGTVLVVEDEQTVRDLATRILAGAGYRVFGAPSPAEAIRTAEGTAGAIDVLLTDVVMPGGITGVDLANRLVATRPRLEVLYMSGYTEEAAVRFGVPRGEARFLAKPFLPDDLLAKVADLLDARDSRSRSTDR
jgi:PAS domain S-box-containing protein